MLDKILIVDFEDSFTFNIANVIYPYEHSIKVMSHQTFFTDVFDELTHSQRRHAVILGPGPGHPEDYKEYYQKIKLLLKNRNYYVMGICLGHQILGKISGLKIKRSKIPMHGQAIDICFKGRMLKVQRYNSLTVFDGSKESDILEFERGISYQFHPESIGTHDNDIFFQDLLEFIQG